MEIRLFLNRLIRKCIDTLEILMATARREGARVVGRLGGYKSQGGEPIGS